MLDDGSSRGRNPGNAGESYFRPSGKHVGASPLMNRILAVFAIEIANTGPMLLPRGVGFLAVAADKIDSSHWVAIHASEYALLRFNFQAADATCEFMAVKNLAKAQPLCAMAAFCKSW
jgi:hypothetical protein